jgi:transposase
MNEVATHWIGIDVAKKTFDAALVCPGQHFPQTELRQIPVSTFQRSPQGVEILLRWMRDLLANEQDVSEPPVVRVVMEATGIYSIELSAWLYQQCPMLSPAIVNPERTAAFTKSLGVRNKTDRLDARALAFYGAERRPAPYEPLTPEHRQLRDLSRYRDFLVSEKVAESNREEQHPENKTLRAIQAKREKLRARDIDKIEKEMMQIIQKDPRLKKDYELLISIPGVAFVTASVMLAEIGDLSRFARARQLAAFAGVSPRQTTSGTSVNGKPRMCKKGNSRIRQALYLAAMSAIRSKSQLATTYQNLCERGKVPMVAIGAIMRKLLTIMRAIIIHEVPFEKVWKTPEKTYA